MCRPYPPSRNSRIEEHAQRHLSILGNADARALIVPDEAKPLAQMPWAQCDSLRAVTTVEELAGRGGQRQPVAAAADDPALLQYTSGSTGAPKGVTLSHANLLANIRAMAEALQVAEGDVFVSWLPLYHDMGLIGAWLGSLHQATPLVLMSPLAFLARPARWLRAIDRFRGTISGGPNFAYELLLRQIRDAELEKLDLSSWRVAFNGAEPVSASTLERFSQRFAAAGLRRTAIAPVYGLAENSVGLAFPPLGRGPLVDAIDREQLARSGRAIPSADSRAIRVVACGRPLPGHDIRIVDAAGFELPGAARGTAAVSRALGEPRYWRNDVATRRLLAGDWRESPPSPTSPAATSTSPPG
ncbi:MAG: AMP-binding protein [Rhodospirillales bacterium]